MQRNLEDVINSAQAKRLSELPDIFHILRPGSERLHGKEMLGRGGEDAKARMVEYPGGR